MRLYLQQPPEGGEQPKYVQLILQQDLLGAWVLIREAGQAGGRIQLKRDLFMDHDSAVSALEKSRDATVRRGYRVMIAQGTGAPKS